LRPPNRTCKTREVAAERFRARFARLVRFGPAAAVVTVAKRLLKPWVTFGTIVVIELPVRRSTPAPGLHVRQIQESDVPLMAAAFGRKPDDLARRLARGDRGYFLFSDADEGEPLHMRWVTTRPTFVPEAGLWLCPDEGTVYLYDVETRPAARGRGLTALARPAMDDSLAADGFHAKVAYIRGDNHPMWRAMSDAPGPLRRVCRVGYYQRPGSPPRVVGRPRWPLTAEPPPQRSTSAIV
jgi:GNAT superfamily N-acetyltransferase